MRIIARKTLRQFVEKLKGSKDQKAVRSALDAWFHEVLRADWKAPADVVKAYANASIVGPDRVVFNIKGNDYRLVVAINYRHQVVFIKWLGTPRLRQDWCEDGEIWISNRLNEKSITSERCAGWRNCGIPRKAPQKAMNWTF